MKCFFYMGRNDRNKSRVSWKLWKVERRGRKVMAWWGPVKLKNRKVVPSGTLQSYRWIYSSEAAARDGERLRIQEKMNKGYQRTPRRKNAAV